MGILIFYDLRGIQEKTIRVYTFLYLGYKWTENSLIITYNWLKLYEVL